MIAIQNRTEGWPEWVWRRTKREFIRGEFEDDRGRCCIVGQARHDFHAQKQVYVLGAIRRVLTRRGYLSSYSIIHWNDSIAKNTQEIADVWNEAMTVELGYEEEFE